jgi:hypothetical protein
MNDKILNTLECDKSSCKPIEIPTDDEVRAPNALRDIKSRVRKLKEIMMNEFTDNSLSTDKIRAESELLQLKKEWEEWEKKKEAAARERMIALGHIER